MDNNWKDGSRNAFENKIVGALESEDKNSDLFFRVACDKIIHGDSISYEYENLQTRQSPISVMAGNLRPVVNLYGKEKNKEP